MLIIAAYYRGSAGQGGRSQQSHPSQQPEYPPSSQFATGPQQTFPGRTSGDSPYQEPHGGTETYEELQPSLPSINSLLGTVQPSEQQQSSPHRRGLSKTQSSPNIRAQQIRQPRSPYSGSGIRSRSQAYNAPSAPLRRESGSLIVPQTWRDEATTHEQFLPQPLYTLDTQLTQRPPPPPISPVRTSLQAPYISPQETPTNQGFDFPYYPQQEPPIGGTLSTPSQNPFYQQPAPTTYITPGTEMIPMQPPYAFNPMGSNISPSGLSYVGDSRAMLPGRAVSMGSLRAPQRLGVSPQEEDKRRRAASASARFRRRKKEQEEENLKEITRLEKKIEDLKKEYASALLDTNYRRDYWRDLAIRAGASGQPPSQSRERS